MCCSPNWPHADVVLSLFTDNSPSEETPVTAEKEEETEESDHEGEPLILKLKKIIAFIVCIHI